MARRHITPATLDNAALFYLQRFASSAENLRRVLLRRVDKLARTLDQEDPDQAEQLRAQAAEWIEALIARYRRAGLLDDATYAAARARSLHRRGTPLAGIARRLMLKGVDADTADEALRHLRDEEPEADRAAAFAFAKRRRLGPFRPAERRAESRDKDLAALGRAGFAYELARQVVDADQDGDADPD